MTLAKWAVIIVVAWLAFRWLSKAYESKSVDLGGSTTGRWAPLLTYQGSPESFAWAPPYGKPHMGAD